MIVLELESKIRTTTTTYQWPQSQGCFSACKVKVEEQSATFGCIAVVTATASAGAAPECTNGSLACIAEAFLNSSPNSTGQGQEPSGGNMEHVAIVVGAAYTESSQATLSGSRSSCLLRSSSSRRIRFDV